MNYKIKALITVIVIHIIIYLLWSFVVVDFYEPLKYTFDTIEGRFCFILSNMFIGFYSFLVWSYKNT